MRYLQDASCVRQVLTYTGPSECGEVAVVVTPKSVTTEDIGYCDYLGTIHEV